MPNPNAPPGSPDAPYGHGFDNFSNRDMEIAGQILVRQGYGPVAHSQLYGAIAYSPSTGRYGWCCKAQDRATAERIALDWCGKKDARIAVWASNAHLALAVADGGVYAWAWDANRRIAKQRALEGCSGTNARIPVIFDTRRGRGLPWMKQRRHWLLCLVIALVIPGFWQGKQAFGEKFARVYQAVTAAALAYVGEVKRGTQ